MWRIIHKLKLRRKESPSMIDLTHSAGRVKRHAAAADHASKASQKWSGKLNGKQHLGRLHKDQVKKVYHFKKEK